MRGNNQPRLRGAVSSYPSLDVFLRLMLDLGFKFLCYVVVYKFYVHIKPRFCRKPVVKTFKKDEDKGNCDEDDKNVYADEQDVIDEKVPRVPTNPTKTLKNQRDELGSLSDEDEDDFVAEAEKLISAINARKSYSSSNTIKALYENLKKMEMNGNAENSGAENEKMYKKFNTK